MKLLIRVAWACQCTADVFLVMEAPRNYMIPDNSIILSVRNPYPGPCICVVGFRILKCQHQAIFPLLHLPCMGDLHWCLLGGSCGSDHGWPRPTTTGTSLPASYSNAHYLRESAGHFISLSSSTLVLVSPPKCKRDDSKGFFSVLFTDIF